MSEQQAEPRLPDFDDLADLFVEQGALVSPAELHGHLVGTLAAGKRLTPERWLAQAAELLGVEELNHEALKAELGRLYRTALDQLEAGAFDLELLIPPDEEAIELRAQALGLWCHGFLSGYALAGGPEREGLSEDARDALADFAQIVHIGAESGDDESEAEFAEVYEYVRMAALLLFSELNRGTADDCAPPGTSLH